MVQYNKVYGIAWQFIVSIRDSYLKLQFFRLLNSKPHLP